MCAQLLGIGLVLCFVTAGIALILLGLNESADIEHQHVETQCTIMDSVTESCTYIKRRPKKKGHMRAKGSKIKYYVAVEDMCTDLIPYPGELCGASVKVIKNGTTVPCFVDIKCSSAVTYIDNPYFTVVVFGAIVLGITVLCCLPVSIVFLCVSQGKSKELRETEPSYQAKNVMPASKPPF